MMDVYDRVSIILEYISQHIDEIATKLEKTTKKEDKIHVSSNTAGVMSGVAGVAAAAAFVTPAGPPLLIASLLFGSAAQMTSSGSKMVNYYSTPNRIAFKIISLYNLLKSVLTVTTVLRDALLKDHIDLEKYVENMIKETEEAVLEMKTGFEEEEDQSEAFTTVTFEDDDFADDDSWATSSSQVSVTSQPQTSAFEEVVEPAMAKIDESKELGKKGGNSNKSTGEIITAAFADLFNGTSTGAGTGGNSSTSNSSNAMSNSTNNNDYDPNENWADFSKADDDTQAITHSSSSLSLGKFGFFGSRKNSSPDKLKPSHSTDSASSTGSQKKSQIDELKQSSHFKEKTDKTAKLARFYSRSSLAGSSLVTAATFTVMAGAALSIVHVAFEANNLAATIKRIQAGSPSKRAQVLRLIKEDLKNLPTTDIIEEEWHKYFEMMKEKMEKQSDHKKQNFREVEYDRTIGLQDIEEC